MKIKFNKEHLIPNILEIVKVLGITLFYIYVLKGFLFGLIPSLNNIPSPFPDLVFVLVIFYLEELFTITWNGKKIYGN